MYRWLRYLIALVVGAHGFVYLRVEQFVPSQLRDWQGSLLLGGVIGSDGVKRLLAALDIGAGVTVIGCALAIAAAPRAPGWWRPLAIAGGLLGLAAFAAFVDGQVGLLVEEGGIGAAVSFALLASAIALGGASRGVSARRSAIPQLRAGAGWDPR